MTCGASNTSFGLPGPRDARRGVPRDRRKPRADERDHGRTLGGDRRRRFARPTSCSATTSGAPTWIAALPQEAGGGARRERARAADRRDPSRPGPARLRAGGRRDQGGARARRHDALRLRELERRSRSTRPAAVTAPARSARCASRPGTQALSSVDPRAFSPEELKAGWRLACRAQAEEDLVVEVPPLQTRPKAALVGVGRHVILRPAVQKRYLELTEPTLEDQMSDLERVLARDGRRRAPRAARARAHARRDAARRRLEGDRGARRRPADRRRARRHERRAATRSRSTSARPPSSRRCSTSRPASRPRCARC